MTSAADPVPVQRHDDNVVLAVIEALRHYFSHHKKDHKPMMALAEEWRAAQLFPPTSEQLRIALSLMSKTDPRALPRR